MNGLYQFIAGFLKWGTTPVVAKQGLVKQPVQRIFMRKIRSEDDFVKFQMPWIL